MNAMDETERGTCGRGAGGYTYHGASSPSLGRRWSSVVFVVGVCGFAPLFVHVTVDLSDYDSLLPCSANMNRIRILIRNVIYTIQYDMVVSSEYVSVSPTTTLPIYFPATSYV